MITKVEYHTMNVPCGHLYIHEMGRVVTMLARHLHNISIEECIQNIKDVYESSSDNLLLVVANYKPDKELFNGGIMGMTWKEYKDSCANRWAIKVLSWDGSISDDYVPNKPQLIKLLKI